MSDLLDSLSRWVIEVKDRLDRLEAAVGTGSPTSCKTSLERRITELEQRLKDNYVDKQQMIRRLDQLEKAASIETPPARYTITPEQYRKLQAFEAIEMYKLEVEFDYSYTPWRCKRFNGDHEDEGGNTKNLAEAVELFLKEFTLTKE